MCPSSSIAWFRYGLLQETHPEGGAFIQTRPDILESSQLAATWVHVRVSHQSIAFVNDCE